MIEAKGSVYVGRYGTPCEAAEDRYHFLLLVPCLSDTILGTSLNYLELSPCYCIFFIKGRVFADEEIRRVGNE
jgi:hypothetical protein